MSTNQQKIVFDIETAGVDFNTLDTQSQQYIINNLSSEEEMLLAKEQLGFYPTTGFIAVIGVLNPDTKKGAMLINNSVKAGLPKKLNDDIEIIAGSEKEILEKFWEICEKYHYFISFNGRGFDVPFLMIRSLANDIRPCKNLVGNRFVYSQKFDAIHIDLFDQLTAYGASRFKYSSLHFFSKLIGVPSPKDGDLTGENVSQAYKEGKVLDIAKYNAGDLYATAELYKKWNALLNI